jgi:Acyl-coenzyme A:6-aminopenicillanic acid acyl-transferase
VVALLLLILPCRSVFLLLILLVSSLIFFLFLVYVQELDGIDAGVASLNNRTLKNVGKIIRRVLLLANLPSDLPVDLVPILQDELAQNPDNQFLRRVLSYLQQEEEGAQEPAGLQCSMFAVWGTRTLGNHVYSCRNLDYAPDTGINTHKLITVWSPSDGGYAHAAFGYTALYGALAGMSSQGVSVHEANLEEDLETFSGFPWVLRLRYVMENARTLSQAQTLWAQTNNTVGYNHMVACEADAAAHGHAAVALETARAYTAYFLDDDPREANAVHVNKQGVAEHYGNPLPEALYRSNHGYDSYLAEHYQWW